MTADRREPLVTAVLVCWNHERFVRTSVLSALQQTYPRLQLIVIDNGSSDGSRRELMELRTRHDFTLICQENVGLVRALNQGLAIAEGEYFTALATDDAWLPGKTALQVAFLEANQDVDLVSAQVKVIDADDKPLPSSSICRPGEATFSNLMECGNFVYGPTVMCRTATLRQIGGFDETLRIEDYSLALRLTYARRRTIVLSDVVTLYRRHDSNWTSRSIDPELAEIGHRYRDTPEYRAFYRRNFPLTFWRLVADGHKMQALRTLVSEPVPWTWANVGRGLLRMLIPYSAIRAYRALKGKPSTRSDRPDPRMGDVP